MNQATSILGIRRWQWGVLLAIVILGVLLTWWTARRADAILRSDYLLRTRLASLIVSVNRIKALTGTRADLDSPDYLRLKEQLRRIRYADPECRFVYLMGRHSDGAIFFLADSEPAGSKDESLPGDVYDDATEGDQRVFEQKMAATVGPETDRWGTWVSPLVPIMDPDTNEFVAVLGMDVDASNWKWHIAANCLLPVGVELLLLIGLGGGLIAHRRSVEREQARRTIEEKEARLESIVLGSPIPAFVIDRDHRVTHWNKAMEDFSGIPAEGIVGTREQWRAFYRNARVCVADLLVDEALGEIPSLYEGILWKSSLIEGAFEGVAFFTEVCGGCWLRSTTAAIRDREGRLVGAIETIEDITERRQIEEGLRESESRFRSVLEGLGMIAVQAHELDGTITFWNKTSEEVYGYAVGEVLGRNIFALLLEPEAAETERALMEESFRTRTAPAAGEFVAATKDGTLRTMYVSRVFHHRAGRLPEIFCFGVDITERKRAEERLRESEERLRMVSDNLPAGMIYQLVMDPMGNRCFTYISAGVEQISGITAEQALRDPAALYDRIHADDRPALAAEEERSWATLSLFNMEVRFETAAGERWGMIRSAPRRLSDGNTLWEGIVIDITEQKRAAEELEQTQALLKAAVEQSPAGILVADLPDMRIRMANSAAFNIHGDTPVSVSDIPVGVLPAQGRLFWPDGTVIPPEDLPISRAALNGETISNVEIVARRPDGEERWLLSNAAPIRNAKGDIVAGMAVFPDITDIKRAEERRKIDEVRREAMLHLYGMSHRAEKEIADYALEALGHITESPLGYIAFANDVEDVLTIYAWSKTAMEECRVGDKPIVYPLEVTGLWGETVRQRRPIVTNDYSAPNPLKRGLPDGHVRLARHLSVPIFDAGKIVIVAGVGNKTEPYSDEDVRPIELLLSFMWSIVKQRRAEESLRESEQRFRGMADHLLDMLFQADEKGHITYVSPSSMAMFGWKPEEMIGRHLTEFVPEDQIPKAMEAFLFTTSTGLPTTGLNLILKRSDESTFSGELNGSAIDVPGGGRGVLVLVRDNTERKRAEESLREKTEEIERYFATALDLFCIGDADGHFRRLNKQWEKTLGYDLADLEGHRFLDFVHPDDVDHTRKGLAELGTQAEAVTLINRFRCKDGSYRWIEWRSYPSGQTVFAAARDITDRKKAEEERERLEAKFLQAQKMEAVGRLAGGVAHDFNNMLFVILAHAEMSLAVMPPKDPLYSVFQEIQKAAQRSSELTRQLLAFARRQTIAPKVLNLNSAVEGMLKMLRRLIGEDIDLLWKPAANLWPVKMDPAQIDQILANLTVNARDAISGVGRMTIETQNAAIDESYCEAHAGFVPGDYIVLAVSDNGCGMDRETQERLFEPFFTTKGSGKGTGLGLATVYGIVQQNNGFINIYSEPGNGTTFRIYLPRHMMAEAAAGKKRSRKALPVGTETVLLVEDEASLLGILQKWMQQLGYKVLAAETPALALELAEKHSGVIHLLMTDVIMPGMNGRDLAKRILERRPELKLLFMSGYTANVIAHHGVLDEGIHFLQKPCDQETLAARLREVLA